MENLEKIQVKKVQLEVKVKQNNKKISNLDLI